MVRPIKRWFVVIMLVLSLGTPWALMQSAGWVSMLANYSRSATFAQALRMTFDGRHPCRLCHLVQKGQAQERQHHPTPEPGQKLELALLLATVALLHPPTPDVLVWDSFQPGTRTESPPTPPPRLA
jgi:hypothetical protein